jgi:hypothetical protein
MDLLLVIGRNHRAPYDDKSGHHGLTFPMPEVISITLRRPCVDLACVTALPLFP